jgi:hypothetical protein
MARNDTRRFKDQPADRAHLRAGAASWRALANLTVASTLVVALFVSVLTLLEAAFSNPASKLARQSPARPELQSRHAHRAFDFSNPATQPEPALFVSD